MEIIPAVKSMQLAQLEPGDLLSSMTTPDRTWPWRSKIQTRAGLSNW